MNRDLIREYLSYLRVEKGLAKNSLEAYRSDLGKLKAWTEKNQLELLHLTRQDLRERLIDLSKAGISENSKRRLISAIRGFYRFLNQEGHILHDPSELLESPRAGLVIPHFLFREQVEQLLLVPDVSTELGLRDRAIIELMYACGLRVSEVVNLQMNAIDFDWAILQCTGKGSKTRKIPMYPTAARWIESYLALRNKKVDITVQNLFLTERGRRLNRQMVHGFIKDYAEKCGLEGVSPHTLRHSFATHLVQNRADIRSVQQMLGHTDISTTQIYTHITDVHLKKSYEMFHPRSKK